MPNTDKHDELITTTGDDDDDDHHHHHLHLQQQTPNTKTTSSSSFLHSFFSIFLTSLSIIFLQHPKLFLSIYLLTSLPLSLLLSALSLSSRRLRSRIFHLQWLSNSVQLLVESGNIQDESRLELRSLLRLKAIYALPICVFSLLSLTASVGGTLSRRPELKTFPAFSLRVGVTTVVNAAVWIVWAGFSAVVGKVVGAQVVLTAALTVTEVLLMTVLSLALVVSVAEETAGVTAVKVALGLMKGRRVVVGWVLSGLILVGSGCIGKEMEGGDWGGYEWTVRMRYGYMGGLIMLLGWVIMWSYVIFTVYYIECRKCVGTYKTNIASRRELEEFS